jgi:hypothetical protein
MKESSLARWHGQQATGLKHQCRNVYTRKCPLGGRLHTVTGDGVPANSAVIAILIMDRPLCLECLSTKTDLPLTEVDRYLGVIETSLQLDRHPHARCHACGIETAVFALHRIE